MIHEMINAQFPRVSPVGAILGKSNSSEPVGQEVGGLSRRPIGEDGVVGLENLFGEGRGADEDGGGGAEAEAEDGAAVEFGEEGDVAVRERGQEVEVADEGEGAWARWEAVVGRRFLGVLTEEQEERKREAQREEEDEREKHHG